MTGYYKRALLLIVQAYLFLAASGQDSALLTSAGIISGSKEINLAKISLESTEIIFNLNKELSQVIPDEDLQALVQKTDATISRIDSLLRNKQDNEAELRNVRSLKNLINYWKRKLTQVETAELMVYNLNKQFDKSRLKNARELSAWDDVNLEAIQYNFDTAVMRRINMVIHLLDSAIQSYGHKSSMTLGVLDKTNAIKIEITNRIDRYDNLLINKQENILRSGHPAFYNLNYSDPDKWDIRGSIKMLHRGETKALGEYLYNYRNALTLHAIILLIIILSFIFLRKSGIPEIKGGTDIYRHSLKVILANPVNSALILGLVAFMIFYPLKPSLFIDLFRLAVSLLLFITLLNLANRKYKWIIISFELMIILRIAISNFPTDLILTRWLMLILAILAIFTMASFIRKVRDANWGIFALQRVVLTLSYIFLILAIGGLISNIAGKVLLSQSLLSAVTGTTLATILIILAMLLFNGLIVLFIDSKYSDFIHVISRRKPLMKEKITRTLQFVAGLFLFYYILESFGFETPIFEWARGFLSKERTIGSASFTWGNIFIFFIVIWASIVVSKIIRIVLEEDVLERMGLAKGLPNTIAMLVRYTLVTGGVLAAASAAGLELTKITIILGAFSVGIGFGLQNIFNNLVSGLILLLERPIKIGDTIEVGPLIGVVKKIGIRASNVHTLDGAEIIVPNGNLISNEVINWTLTDKRRRIDVTVGVAYGSNPYQVQELFMKILAEHPDVVKEPKPNVFFNNFGDSSIDFKLLFWTDNFDEWVRIRSEVIFKIHDVLQEAGIAIPFPQRDVHIYQSAAGAGTGPAIK
jgi:small-conductance mechanosensitive channel